MELKFLWTIMSFVDALSEPAVTRTHSSPHQLPAAAMLPAPSRYTRIARAKKGTEKKNKTITTKRGYAEDSKSKKRKCERERQIRSQVFR